jgi:hypothetical protein
MNRLSQANSLPARGAAFNLCLIVAALQSPAGASAQQSILNTLSAQATPSIQPVSLANQPYTFKSGDFRLLLTPSLAAEWNNNIDATKTNVLQDYIISPSVQISATYPLTQVNLLRLTVGVGYDEYVDHSDYSDWHVTSGSALSFDTYVKDFLINVHDRFSFSQSSGGTGADLGSGGIGAGATTTGNGIPGVTTGVGNNSTGNNVAGLSGTWNPKKFNIVLGYDHQTTLSSGTAIQSQNGDSDLFNGRFGWRFGPASVAGLESTYSTTSYNEAVLNNNTSYTFGAYAQWHPGTYFTVAPRAGYSIFQYQQTSQSGDDIEVNSFGNPVLIPTGKPIQTSDFDSWYADLTLTHAITRALSYSFDIGHTIQEGIQSDAVSDSYLRISSTWKIIKDWDLRGTFSLDHGQQGVGNVTGNATGTYNTYSGALDLNHQLSKKLRVGLNARLTYLSSDSSSLGFTQAIVGVRMAYIF